MSTELAIPEEKISLSDKIDRLEATLLSLPQVEIEPTHIFADGLYSRQIVIPAGVAVTGKEHKREHLNILSKGRITVLTNDGMRTVEAPFIMVSPPGTKRAGYAHTECVWTTVHANPENIRDIPTLEELFVVNSRIQTQEQACLS